MPGTGPEAPAGVGGGVLPEEGARAVLLQPFPAPPVLPRPSGPPQLILQLSVTGRRSYIY